MKKFFVILSAVLALSTFTACKKDEEVLNIFTWDSYVPKEVVESFEKETGIKVVYSNFSTNDEMLAKVRASKGNEYDIIICSDYYIDIMRNENLLQTIDSSKITNYKNIDPAFQSKYYDPENKYTIPYSVANALIAYDKEKVPFEITSYEDLWRPELKNSIVALNDVRGMLGMVLLMNNGSVNETDEAVLADAAEKLYELKPNIVAFNSDTPHELLISGSASVGFMFGSQITAAMENVDSVTYVFPKEGITYSADSIVINNNTANIENSYKFIDYVLDGEVSAKISSNINYINCNLAAKEFLPDEFLNNKTLNIPSELMNTAQGYEDLGDATVIYNDIWTTFKSK